MDTTFREGGIFVGVGAVVCGDLRTVFWVCEGPGVGAVLVQSRIFEFLEVVYLQRFLFFLITFNPYESFSSTLEAPRLLSIHLHFKNRVFTPRALYQRSLLRPQVPLGY